MRGRNQKITPFWKLLGQVWGSIKNWTAGMTMKARDEGLIEDYEYWTAERIANDMAKKARIGKRKLY